MKIDAPQTIKIVTVDDSLLIAERLQVMLSDLIEVRYIGNATNAASALNLVKNMTPHVAILDVKLDDNIPLNDGISLLKILKKSYPGIKVIMFTNLSGEYYKRKCIDLGADYFLDKTNDFDKIPEILANMKNQFIEK